MTLVDSRWGGRRQHLLQPTRTRWRSCMYMCMCVCVCVCIGNHLLRNSVTTKFSAESRAFWLLMMMRQMCGCWTDVGGVVIGALARALRVRPCMCINVPTLALRLCFAICWCAHIYLYIYTNSIYVCRCLLAFLVGGAVWVRIRNVGGWGNK